jgi:hypothetical protein
MNIPYKVYQGTPKSNVPYKQPKEGDSSQFTYKPVAKPKFFNIKSLEIPWKIDKAFKLSPNPETYPIKDDDQYIRIPSPFEYTYFSSPNIPDFYVTTGTSSPKFYLSEPPKPPQKNIRGDGFSKGSDYSNSITQNLLKSMEVKTMKELGFEDVIKKSYDSLNIPSYKEITYDTFYGETGDYSIEDINRFLNKKVSLIPKDLADKYFIKSPSSINDKDYQRKGIPKK